MSVQQAIIVDTNILFSCLLSNQSNFAQTLLDSTYDFFVCEQVIVELFKHKEKLVKISKISEEEILLIYKLLLKHISLYKEDLILHKNIILAYELCQ